MRGEAHSRCYGLRLGDIVGDGADDDSREAYIAISAKIRKVFPHSKPRTKAQVRS